MLTGAKLFKVEYTLAEPQSLDYAQIALVEIALVEIALVEIALVEIALVEMARQ